MKTKIFTELAFILSGWCYSFISLGQIRYSFKTVIHCFLSNAHLLSVNGIINPGNNWPVISVSRNCAVRASPPPHKKRKQTKTKKTLRAGVFYTKLIEIRWIRYLTQNHNITLLAKLYSQFCFHCQFFFFSSGS